MHTWTMADGRTLKAKLVNRFGDKAVLRNEQGKTIKIPLNQLSAEDAEYLELAQPPALDINFLNTMKTVDFNGGFYDASAPSSARRNSDSDNLSNHCHSGRGRSGSWRNSGNAKPTSKTISIDHSLSPSFISPTT